jgi:hypothetical protein
MELNDFINNWLASWTGNNPNKLLPFYSENAFYLDPANPLGIKGKDNLSVYFSKLLSKNPDWIWKAEEIIPTEKGCTLKWKAQIFIGKESIILFGLDIIEIKNWEITRNEVYFDRSTWMEAIRKAIQ